MEHQSKTKKPKHAQPAKEPEYEKGDSQLASTQEDKQQGTKIESPLSPAPAAPNPPTPVSIADLAQGISEDKVKIAENLGIPIRPLLKWAYTMEQTVIAQGKALESLGVNLKPLIDYAKQMQPQTGTANPTTAAPTASPGSPQGGMMGSLMQLLPTALNMLGGSGGSGITDKIVEAVLQGAISNMQVNNQMNSIIMQSIAKKMGVEIADTVGTVAK